jgi:hypothetical protein
MNDMFLWAIRLLVVPLSNTVLQSAREIVSTPLNDTLQSITDVFTIILQSVAASVSRANERNFPDK